MGVIKTARKYELPITFQETHKLFMDCNHLPVIKGSDNAIWNRLYLIPFNVEIPQEKIDPHLRDKLIVEAEGILAWMVDGAKRFYAQNKKLVRPNAIRAAVQEWRDEMDIVAPFLHDVCIVNPADTKLYFAKSAIWEAYARWSDAQADHKRLDRGGFFEYLHNQGFKEGKAERATLRVIRGLSPRSVMTRVA
jgi:putative DNA primase/helicase